MSGLLQASRVSGSTALHEASRCGRVDVLRWLLCHSADCRQMDGDGSEALQVEINNWGRTNLTDLTEVEKSNARPTSAQLRTLLLSF